MFGKSYVYKKLNNCSLMISGVPTFGAGVDGGGALLKLSENSYLIFLNKHKWISYCKHCKQLCE
jgi:hypothetical protein